MLAHCLPVISTVMSILYKKTINNIERRMATNYWFEESEKYKTVVEHLGISVANYLLLIDSIKKVFPKTWVSKELARHDKTYPPVFTHNLLPVLFTRLQYNPVPMTMGGICGGDLTLPHLIRLGQLIQSMEVEIGAKQLFERLRGGPADYMSARFELEVLEKFKSAGYSLKKPIEADGVDFTFEKNDRKFFIEASHRGASDILDLADEIFSKSFNRGFQGHSNRHIRLKLKYEIDYYTDVVIEKIVHKIVEVSHGFSEGFDDPEGYYSIFVEKSEKNSLSIGWHDPTSLVYEAIQLFKNKLQDKLKQLLRNLGSYGAIDMRSLIPCIVDWRNKDASMKILKGCLSYTCQFFKEYPTIGGVFIWVLHAGRVKNTFVDQMDQDEIILVNAPHHLLEEDALQLFPFAKLPRELNWYHTNLDYSA